MTKRVTDWNQMQALVGKRVKVILDWHDPEGVSIGFLECLDIYGEVRVLCDDGIVRYGWPALALEELENEEPENV